jgi:uroporphyrinogen decarboxylase
MQNSKNSNFIKALRQEKVSRRPVWMMRQAGRYLPEYRELRGKFPDFLTFCRTPEAAAEATIQPITRFDLDAAIMFSDILLLPDAMGAKIEFCAGAGPILENPLHDANVLHAADEKLLQPVYDMITLIKKNLPANIPLIGFAGAPWTVATYLLNGGSSKDHRLARIALHSNANLVHGILRKLADASVQYLTMQLEAGVDALMLFETWAALLSPGDFECVALHYVRDIIARVRAHKLGREVPIIYFAKGVDPYLEKISLVGADALGLDWTSDIGKVRTRLNGRVALQGNFDPALLFADHERIRAEVQSIKASFGDNVGHVFNLGHGIDRQTPIENVAVFLDEVHKP